MRTFAQFLESSQGYDIAPMRNGLVDVFDKRSKLRGIYTTTGEYRSGDLQGVPPKQIIEKVLESMGHQLRSAVAMADKRDPDYQSHMTYLRQLQKEYGMLQEKLLDIEEREKLGQRGLEPND